MEVQLIILFQAQLLWKLHLRFYWYFLACFIFGKLSTFWEYSYFLGKIFHKTWVLLFIYLLLLSWNHFLHLKFLLWFIFPEKKWQAYVIESDVSLSILGFTKKKKIPSVFSDQIEMKVKKKVGSLKQNKTKNSFGPIRKIYEYQLSHHPFR